jgi:GNAT superfamily N-acetyltransferase
MARFRSTPASSGRSGLTDLGLRPARAHDAPHLLAIQRAASVAAFAHIYPPELYPFPDAEVLRLWEEALDDPSVDVYLAVVDGKPVGSVSVDDAWLRTLYVLPALWSRGVGSALLEHGLQRMRERGARFAKLWTLEENEAGRRFYERRGWALTDETRVVPFPPHPIDVQYAKEL